MDLLILIVLIVIVVCAYRDVKFVSYLFGILEIFFRIVHYLGDNIPIINCDDLASNKYKCYRIIMVFRTKKYLNTNI